MLYVFFGTDTTKVRQEAFSFLEKLEDETCEVSKIVANEYTNGMVVDLAQGSALFGTKQIVVFDTPSEDKSVEDELFKHLKLMQESINHFIIIDGAYDVARKKKIEKYSDKTSETKAGKKERFNVFSLTDAFLRRDKKTLWLLLSAAWRDGISNEEIIGILFWQIKILRLVSKTSTAEESGQKPFVYQKAKRALQSFKEGEVDSLSYSLLSIYHDGHLGLVDLDLALEKWVLEM